MRIVGLTAENFKRLRAVEITPEGDVVVIAGRNAQGKSSVLDAIWAALAGAAGAKETPKPIREGEKHASVELNLGDMVVTRHWNEGGTSNLTVAAADGARYPKPQSVLDALIGRLTFDPLAFAESSQKDQLATLLSVVELPFDPAKVAMERQGVFDQRTDVNREVRRLEGAMTEIPAAPDDTPDEEVSAASLAAELEAATEANRVRDQAQSEFAALVVQIEEAERRRDELRVFLEESQNIDTTAMRERLEAADVTNAAVWAKRQRQETRALLVRAQGEVEELTARLVAIDARKEKALQEATMPLDGLSFDDEGVLYNGVPFSQVSASEKLRASMAIAMALNPKIRVLRITDGSLLDSENMALISEMASEHDFQVWIERVDESGEVGITIEDGAIA
jgi:hypothetical protein